MGRLITYAIFITAAACTGCNKSDAPPPPPGPAPTQETANSSAAPKHGLASVDTSTSRSRTNTESAHTPPDDPSEIRFLNLRGPTDPTWRWEPPKNAMRITNWIVPAPEGAEPAELVITHFPEAAGNTRDANIARWSSQFRADDLPPQAEVTEITAGTMPATLVELQGEYLGMGGGWHKADYAMVVAMVDSDQGSIFIKLLGDAETVDATRDTFMALVEGLKPAN